MARLDTSGIDELALSLEELADIPEDVLQEMLVAEGEVVKAAHEQKIRAMPMKKRTGQLEESITINRKMKRDGSGTPGITVYPAGVRKDGKTRNAEVGFILEYGAPQRGISPRPWMRTANEECAEEAVSAAAKVYGNWLEGNGL